MKRGRLAYSESVISAASQIGTFRRTIGTETTMTRHHPASARLRSALAKVTPPINPPSEPAMRSGQGPSSDRLTGYLESDISYISRPLALEELHTRGIDGRGVTVAVIDSGVSPHHDFGDRIKAFKDFGSRKRNPHDPKGHGTHVAGIILGDGARVDGIAPKADLVACRISSEQEAIKAVDWVIANKEKYSIDILNLSLGVEPHRDPAQDEFLKAAERAVDAGLVVVVAAGNECKGDFCPSTISSPGISPKVITVGALDDKGTLWRKDDSVWEQSSQGTAMTGKPDLIAEGTNVLSVLAPDSVYSHRVQEMAHYLALSGSSQAAPMVAGAAALMLQVNPLLSHQQVKSILAKTANQLPGVAKTSQGAGRLDLDKAVEAASKLEQLKAS